jgi:hypothetical protein
MASLNTKIIISLKSSILFLIINLPQTYQVMNNLFGEIFYNKQSKCPTNWGLIIHTLIFFTITYIGMSSINISNGIKLKHSLYGTLIFYIISSPALFSVMGSLLGNWVSTSSGCPTLPGILLHSVIFCMALVGVMYLP